MKTLLLALALMASIQAGAGMKTLPCGARVPDDMGKSERVARCEWALPNKQVSAPAPKKGSGTARAADAQKQ